MKKDFYTENYTALFKMDNQQGPTIVHGTLLNVMWWPGQEGSLDENKHMRINMYGWDALQSNLNYHNIVNWLYSNTK